jgi:hypothetical protein
MEALRKLLAGNDTMRFVHSTASVKHIVDRLNRSEAFVFLSHCGVLTCLSYSESKQEGGDAASKDK